MKINSAYYRQEGSCRTSLLLQQVYDTKKERGIMLGCVCTHKSEERDTDERLCDGLLGTFRQNILPTDTGNMEKCCAYIKTVLDKTQGDIAYSGMFLSGDEILLFGYGFQRIYLLNSVFMRPHLELLSGNTKSDESFFNIYKIEPGAAVIAATEPFFEHMDEEMLKECLYVTNDITGIKTGKHIKEYGRHMEEAGGLDMGAVIVKVITE